MLYNQRTPLRRKILVLQLYLCKDLKDCKLNGLDKKQLLDIAWNKEEHKHIPWICILWNESIQECKKKQNYWSVTCLIMHSWYCQSWPKKIQLWIMIYSIIKVTKEFHIHDNQFSKYSTIHRLKKKSILNWTPLYENYAFYPTRTSTLEQLLLKFTKNEQGITFI